MTRSFNPLDHPEAEVSRAHFCQLAGRSKMTAYRHERSDPCWPRPIIRSGRVFYKAIDCKRYLQSAQSRVMNPSLRAPSSRVKKVTSP